MVYTTSLIPLLLDRGDRTVIPPGIVRAVGELSPVLADVFRACSSPTLALFPLGVFLGDPDGSGVFDEGVLPSVISSSSSVPMLVSTLSFAPPFFPGLVLLGRSFSRLSDNPWLICSKPSAKPTLNCDARFS